MMNTNQYPQNAYYQNASAYPKTYPANQQSQSNMPNGHWPQQMSVQTPGKKPQYQGQPMEQPQSQPYPHSPSYQHQNTYYPRPMHSPNTQQYPPANQMTPQAARNYPAQHQNPSQRYNNSYPNTPYRNESETKNSYPYPTNNNYNYDSPRTPLQSAAYNQQQQQQQQQQNMYSMPSQNMSYPQRQYIEPRNYGNNINNDSPRMRYPANYNSNFNQQRLPSSSVSTPPPQMTIKTSAPSQNFNSIRAQSPSLPVQNATEQMSNFIKKEPNDRHLRQALSTTHLTKEKVAETIESTKAVFKKIKPLTNIGNVDHRKILMSLKSGLLAETTWAFDCLNILSNNGNLKLAVLPSLLTNLLDYYKCFLNLLFDDLFADTENDYQIKMIENDHKAHKEEFENLIRKGEKVFLLDSTNYTFKSRFSKSNRNGLPVQVTNEPNLNSLGLQIINDLSNLEETCDYKYFQDGNGLVTAHIITNMEPIDELISFTKCSKSSATIANQVSQKRSKRKLSLDFEAEMYQPKDTTLIPRRESLDSMLKRCYCISTIIRNLSFLPENSLFMSKNSALLLVLARLVAFSHDHSEKKSFEIINDDLENKTFEQAKLEASEMFRELSHEALHMIRMNTLVTLSNMSEFLDLAEYSDKIILPLLDSLLHWAICQSAYAKDTYPPDGLSFQLLVFEIIVKLSMKVTNIDLMLATPPFSRIEEFYRILVRSTGKEEDQVLRELSIVILSNFSNADILSARIILHHDYSISNLLMFIEQHDFTRRTQLYGRFSSAMEPFTITYMLKHAATTLRTLATECDLKELPLIKRHEDRIVDLIMSNVLEPEVTNILADLIFILSNDKSK